MTLSRSKIRSKKVQSKVHYYGNLGKFHITNAINVWLFLKCTQQFRWEGTWRRYQAVLLFWNVTIVPLYFNVSLGILNGKKDDHWTTRLLSLLKFSTVHTSHSVCSSTYLYIIENVSDSIIFLKRQPTNVIRYSKFCTLFTVYLLLILFTSRSDVQVDLKMTRKDLSCIFYIEKISSGNVV